MKNKGYMVILREKTLKMDVLAFEDGIETMHKNIQCRTIDHATGVDELEHKDIDMWVDDEGLLAQKMPVIIFVDENVKPIGQLVGNILFQKSNKRTGESYGLTLEEVEWLQDWIKSHQVAEYVSGMVYDGENTGDTCYGLIVRPDETIEHRKRIADMMEMAKRNGWDVMGF